MASVSDRAAYRSDIDGLRAVAVLLVIGFHFFPRQVPGGFIGVDVFFVISGFLITRLIRAGLEDGSFSLADFYARRIRRIFPALGVVLVACLIAGWLLLFPLDYRDLGKHAAASAVFIANFTFLQEAGYFDTASELKPLLHLWSLGVEEQFYIVCPLLLMLVWRWRSAPIVLAVLLLAVSFAWNVWLTGTNALAAFYLPVTRFWELMLGCILAIGLPAGRATAGPSDRVRDAASLAGVTLLVVAIMLIDRQKSFPGWWAAFPTLGTALLIFAGPQAYLNRGLSYRPLVYIGLISYPLYLWHWPIVAFARHFQLKEPTALVKVVYIGAAFLLAHWTYRYLEKPIRFGPRTPRTPIVLSAALALIGLFGALIFLAGGFPGRYPSEIQNLFKDYKREAVRTFGIGLCVSGVEGDTPVLTNDCPKPDPDRGHIAVWGDSHAAHLIRGLSEIERSRGSIQVTMFTAHGCPPVVAFASAPYPHCITANETIIERIGRLKPDTVIMGAHWRWRDRVGEPSLVDEQSIQQTVARLRSMGVRRVVGVGEFPVWEYDVTKILARNYRLFRGSFGDGHKSDAIRSTGYLVPWAFPTDENIGRAFRAAGAIFVSPPATLCNADGCLLTVPGTSFEPVAWDQTHLTNAGSIYFVARNAEALIGN